MCGITGFIGEGGVNDLEKMVHSLSHRGPDDRGLFLEQNVGLGHTRLSIIDLSPTGHQPMFSGDKKIGIVFNGEIYNFQELKKDLINDGYKFIGTSDTEVIIALYKKFGEECFCKMNGMFAIAIYDFEKNKLILAKDRLGKKPLYWAVFGETFIFGSELKSLMQHPFFVKKLDLDSLNLYLQLDYVPTPRTIFESVYKLEPGTYLVFGNNKIEKKTFWEFKSDVSSISFNDALSKLDELIQKSVNSRMISDVPLGIFLSGGLDSSAIAYYAQKSNKEKINTFSIGFEEKSFDESEYAKMVSKFLGTKHYHKNLSSKETLDLMPNIVEILDEPMADSSIVPTYLLSKFTKEKVTVALGGDGGDELFAGYPTFQADRFVEFYEILPVSFRNFIKYVINKIPASEVNFSLGFKLKKFVNGISRDRFLTHQNWLGAFDVDELSMLLKDGNKNPDLMKEYCDEVESSIKIKDEDNRLTSFYMKTYMMDEVMVKVDRASMKASLETRSPFLDYEVVEFVSSLPYSFKLKGLITKYILKKLMESKLPEEIVWRKKKGFGIPLAAWLKNDLKPLCESLLSKEEIDRQGIFNYEYIRKLLDDHFYNKQDNRKKIWNLMVFQMWYKKYMLN